MSPAATPPVLSAQALCPSCRRFVGPADVCPYCGEDAARRPLLRRLRWAALFLAVGGLALLYAAAARRPAPLIRIGDIAPPMNFAHVRVSGRMVAEPRIARRAERIDSVALVLDDGTGQLRITAEGATAAAWARMQPPPAVGSSLEAAGTLRVSAAAGPRLYARQLAPRPGAPP